jgi:predicted esterase YcpF (UPF0227 family)
VLYLHGFLSSPQSLKAQQTLAYCLEIGLGETIAIPLMNHGPAETIAQLHALIDENDTDQLVLMGSSLGGYYATYLSEFYQAPAVLINPAVRPYELWESHLGENRNYYSDEVHVVTRSMSLYCQRRKISKSSYKKETRHWTTGRRLKSLGQDNVSCMKRVAIAMMTSSKKCQSCLISSYQELAKISDKILLSHRKI